jgi:AcrR family transcriptional regulator
MTVTDMDPLGAVPSKGRPRRDQIMGGLHGLTREQVEDSQRQRLLAATTELMGEQGYSAIRVADVTERAGVSRKSFYAFYADKEDAFVDCYDRALAGLVEVVEQAVAGSGSWLERLRTGVAALLDALGRDPAVARICFVETLAAGPKALRWRNVAMGELVGALGINDGPAAELTAVAILGETLQREIAAGRAEQLSELTPSLLRALLVPVLGPVEAERALAAETALPLAS